MTLSTDNNPTFEIFVKLIYQDWKESNESSSLGFQQVEFEYSNKKKSAAIRQGCIEVHLFALDDFNQHDTINEDVRFEIYVNKNLYLKDCFFTNDQEAKRLVEKLVNLSYMHNSIAEAPQSKNITNIPRVGYTSVQITNIPMVENAPAQTGDTDRFFMKFAKKIPLFALAIIPFIWTFFIKDTLLHKNGVSQSEALTIVTSVAEMKAAEPAKPQVAPINKVENTTQNVDSEQEKKCSKMLLNSSQMKGHECESFVAKWEMQRQKEEINKRKCFDDYEVRSETARQACATAGNFDKCYQIKFPYYYLGNTVCLGQLGENGEHEYK